MQQHVALFDMVRTLVSMLLQKITFVLNLYHEITSNYYDDKITIVKLTKDSKPC